MTTDSNAPSEHPFLPSHDDHTGTIHIPVTSYDEDTHLVWPIPPMKNDRHEQELKDDLIQRATTRLRRRRLEERLLDVLKDVAGMQEQLETLRVEATATIDVVHAIEDDTPRDISAHARKLDTLERQLQGHLCQLEQLRPAATAPPTSSQTSRVPSTPSLASALSMSRLSPLSLMSSVFSRSSSRSSVSSVADSMADSMTDYQYTHDDDACTITTQGSDPVMSSAEEQQRRHRRRRRIKQFRQRYQKHVREDPAYAELVLSDSWPPSNPALHAQRRYGKDTENDDLATTVVYGWETDTYASLAHPHDNDYREPRVGYLPMPIPSTNVWDRHTDDDSSDSLSLCSTASSLSQPAEPPIFSRLAAHRQLLLKEAGLDGYRDTYGLDDDEARTTTDDALDARWESKSNSLDGVDEIWTRDHPGAPWSKAPVEDERNVLDDALSFLNGFSENGEDNEFCEDVYLLLDNPELCCRPLSEIRETVAELRQQQAHQQGLTSPLNPGAVTSMPLSMVLTSLKWCKFLSVLSATVMISLLNGPDDILATD